jgi:DNA-binding response OmpR family regulator
LARILIVEDDTWIASLIADELTDRGYSVRVARNGIEALACLQAGRPDAIVLDLMMPAMHGWDFIDRYQQQTGGSVIPIVVVSAAGAVPKSTAGKGVRQFLSKPFDIAELAASVGEAVNETAPPGAAVPTRSPLEAITPLGFARRRAFPAVLCTPEPYVTKPGR